MGYNLILDTVTVRHGKKDFGHTEVYSLLIVIAQNLLWYRKKISTVTTLQPQLEIFQNSQESTCNRVFGKAADLRLKPCFFNKLIDSYIFFKR